MTHRLILALTVTIATAAVTLSADNWPQWRGPLATGASAEKGLPEKWSTGDGRQHRLEGADAEPQRRDTRSSGTTPCS